MSAIEPRRRAQIEHVLGRQLTQDELAEARSLEVLSEAQRDVVRTLGPRSVTVGMVYVMAVVPGVEFGDASRFIEQIQNERLSIVKNPWSRKPGLGRWKFQIPRAESESIHEMLSRCIMTIAGTAATIGRLREVRLETQSIQPPATLESIPIGGCSSATLVLDLAVNTGDEEQVFESASSVEITVESREAVVLLAIDTDIYSAVTWSFSKNTTAAALNAPRLERFLTALREELHAHFVSSEGLVPVNDHGFAWP